MTRRDWTGTVLELGITRPLLFCGAAWLIGTALGTLRALVILAAAEDVDIELPDEEWVGSWIA